VVVIGTCGGDGIYLVATWGDFVRAIGIQDGNKIIIPAGGYQQTEENLKGNNKVQVLIGSKQIEGTPRHGNWLPAFRQGRNSNHRNTV